jgi:hypothetical protein
VAETVYVLCALTSAGCAALLVRSWLATRAQLLLWSSACFVGLFLNNLLLVADLVLFPDVDLALLRSISSFVSVAPLALALIWEGK